MWGPAMAPEAVQGIGDVYRELLQPHRAAQADFLKALVQQFSSSCSPHDGHSSLPGIRYGLRWLPPCTGWGNGGPSRSFHACASVCPRIAVRPNGCSCVENVWFLQHQASKRSILLLPNNHGNSHIHGLTSCSNSVFPAAT